MQAGRKPERAQCWHHLRTRTPDAGYSLVEVAVAVALMGIAVVPIMIAGIVSVRASAQTSSAAKVETVLANAADRVNRANEDCDYDDEVEAAVLSAASQSPAWENGTAVAAYEWYQPATESPVTLGTWNAGACPGSDRPEGLVQKVTITVTSPDGKLSRTMQVVKSDV